MIFHSIVSYAGPELGNVMWRSLAGPVAKQDDVVVDGGGGCLLWNSQISGNSCTPPRGNSVDVGDSKRIL